MIKTFTKTFKALLVALTLMGLQDAKAQCSANFTFSYNANGNVSFYSMCSPSVGIGRSWSFGNSQTSTQANPSVNYNANGIYTVCLTMWTPSVSPTCSASICQTINVTNAPTQTCFVVANFSYTQSANGLVNFVSTSTNTTASTSYSWNFGDNTNGTGVTTSHTYSSNLFYNVTLIADNGNACSSSTTINVPVTTVPCNLNASFSVNQLGNGNVQFVSTSTGTVAGTQYAWVKNNTFMGSGNSITGNFTNGTHTIVLQANNSFSASNSCTSTSQQVITVTSNTCNVQANFTFTQGANGLVNFTSASTGTSANTTYSWNFANGFTASGIGPYSTTYTVAGYYSPVLYVQESPTCTHSVAVGVNVTSVPCSANSNFTLTQISPGNWQATPAYPYNVVWAQWSWGDNTTSNQLITSHTYSPTGLYNICLTVSVSCAAQSSSTCATYSITKMAQPIAMAYVQVVMPPTQSITTGLMQASILSEDMMVYPNPSNGNFDIRLVGLNEKEAKIKVYSLTGQMVYESKGNIVYGNLDHTVNLKQAAGVYFIKIESGANVITKKIILKD